MYTELDVLLACVHLYSQIGDRRKSRYYDKLFVHKMKQYLKSPSLDSHRHLE